MMMSLFQRDSLGLFAPVQIVTSLCANVALQADNQPLQ
jgi:hypothetical protein